MYIYFVNDTFKQIHKSTEDNNTYTIRFLDEPQKVKLQNMSTLFNKTEASSYFLSVRKIHVSIIPLRFTITFY